MVRRIVEKKMALENVFSRAEGVFESALLKSQITKATKRFSMILRINWSRRIVAKICS
jgi:hypothetical protein